MSQLTFYRNDLELAEWRLVDELVRAAVEAHGLSALLHVTGSYADSVPAVLTALWQRRPLFGHLDGLYRVDDLDDLHVTLFDIGMYGEAVVLVVRQEVVADVVRDAQARKLRSGLGRSSSLPDLVGPRTPYFELATHTEHDSVLSATFSTDLPADLHAQLRRLQTGTETPDP